MDNTFMKASPAIILANHYQCAAGQRMTNGPVHSCMQLWCRAGRGSVTVNGAQYELPPGRALLLPWRHIITYTADHRQPFLLSGIHVVPATELGRPLIGMPSHDGTTAPGYSEGEHPLGNTVHGLELSEHPALEHLSEYALLAFLRGPSEADQRQHANLLLVEWSRALTTQASCGPPALARARRFVLDNLSRRLDRESLARAVNLSPATLHRLCVQHLQASPVAWAQRLRIDAAKPLVAGSRLSLNELAERFGFCDAFHFSRAFKRHTGLAPDRWRRKHALL